ncbi:short chain dehydrogenase [Ramicandelaber brevisporus]|nr:short chain dehydrogenase [Ramicandelaber brevisporus]
MSLNKELAGKVALVTGASANLGREIVLGLARAGADVVVHYNSDSSRANAEQVASEAQKLNGGRAIVIQGNLTDVPTVKRVIADVVSNLGRLDIVVNNAGIFVRKTVDEITEEDFDKSFNTNTKAPFFVMQEAVRKMGDGGRIVNISTSLMTVMSPQSSIYCGSKAPLESFSKALAKEVGGRGITINTVAPGPLDTPFFYEGLSEQQVAFYKNMSPMGRLGLPGDIADVVSFLASEKSRWVNGQIVFVNGGFNAR